MYFLKDKDLLEKEALNEMSLRIMSDTSDNLPFKVIIKSPDKGKYDHAHIIKLGTRCEEIGAFVITKHSPRSVKDLVGYCEGQHKGLQNIPVYQLQMLVEWASKKNALMPFYTNWQMMQYEYCVNRRDF